MQRILIQLREHIDCLYLGVFFQVLCLFSKFHYVYVLLFLFHFLIGFVMALYLCYDESNKKQKSKLNVFHKILHLHGIKGNCEI